MSASKKKKPGKVKDTDKAKVESKKKDAGAKDTPKASSNPESVAIVEPQTDDAEPKVANLEPVEMDSRCDFCNAPIYSGKAIKCDECGVIVHQFCFNSHAITKHRPPHTIVEVFTESVYDDTGAFKGQKSNYRVVANV